MKKSLYNTTLSLPDGTQLIFNALTDKFVALFDESINLDNVISSEDHAGVEDETYNNLITAGIIVEDSLDEIQILQDRINQVDGDDTTLTVHVNPTLDCNFHCWYCYENHIKDSRISQNVINNLNTFVCNRISDMTNLKRIYLSFFGGEPLLAFDEVRQIITGTSKLCTDNEIQLHVSFTSNAYLLTEQMVEFLADYPCSFQITLDGGREQHDQTRFGKGGIPSYDRILENIMMLVDKGIHTTIRVNYTSKNIDSASQICSFLKKMSEKQKKYVAVDFQRVWQDKPDYRDQTYDKVVVIREEMKQKGFIMYNNQVSNTVAGSCYGDKHNYVLINFNGDVFCCTARDFKSENRMGTLEEDGIHWNKQKRNLRLSAKFSKPVCKVCRYAPLCGGGCRQQAVDNYNKPTCHYNYSSEDIDDRVLERFEYLYMNQ